jgi:hypothetical protein
MSRLLKTTLFALAVLFILGIGCAGGSSTSTGSESSSLSDSGLAPIPSLPPSNTHDTDTRIFLNFYMGGGCAINVPFCCLGCNPNNFFDFLDGKLELVDFFVPQQWMECETNDPMNRIMLLFFQSTPGERSCETHSDPTDPNLPDFVECDFIPETETTCQEIYDLHLNNGDD